MARPMGATRSSSRPWGEAVIGLALLAFLAAPQDAPHKPWAGPGRFCGFSPIIDLREGETIEPLTGGIHSGTFRWTGSFGTLEVRGIQWASKPPGHMLGRRTAAGMRVFAGRVKDGAHVVAIWNGQNGAAYFQSPRALTPAQIEAIGRVTLFNEGEEPEGCKYRTVFSWE